MQRLNSRRTQLLASALLALVGASIVRRGWRGPAVQASRSPGNLDIATLQEQFFHPPDDSKIMVRWWWFGPAVTTEELDREMRQMKDAGVGGFEVATVYPLTLDDPAKGLINLRFLSPEHLAAVGSAARTARGLGLRMDMTMGSGWPYGGPHIRPELAAEKLEVRTVDLPEGLQTTPGPEIPANKRFVAAFVAPRDWRQANPGAIQQVARQQDVGFRLPAAPSEPRVLLVFVAGLTGQQVKRAAVGAEGNVLDHYSRVAIEKHFEAVGGPLVEAGGGNIRAMFCDSLEVVGSDWTQDFLSEFQRRRGYDLTPHLPALVAGNGPEAASIRHDWGQTLTELFNENFLAPYQAWCHAHHVLARVQAYGEPPAQLSSYRFVDLPEGEQGDEAGHWNHFTASRWASSAGHDYGVPVISAEAWTWIHALPFRATPLDFKAMADEYFLEGINQLVGHGWPYSPPGVTEPGWHFYAAGAIDPPNPWWFAMPDLARYLQRASYMLRQGRPANDVAVYLPTHDAWASLHPGHVNLWEAIWRRLGPDLLPSLLEAGYDLDFIDDEILARNARIENGKLVIADQQFSVVVMPAVERIPLATLAKLGEFARSGGVLTATRHLPALAPGFLHQEAESAEVEKLVQALFKDPSAPGRLITDEGVPLQVALARLLPPDADFSPPSREIGFIHRHTDTAEIYFLANTSDRHYEGTATFRVKGKSAEWWDLFTGEVTKAGSSSEGNAVVKFDIEPYGSRLLVFSNREAAKSSPPAEAPLPNPVDLSRGWQVTFGDTGKTLMMDELRSWTEVEGMKFYSGRATYRKSFGVPADFLTNGVRIFLNFGEGTPLTVQQSAYFQAWLDGPVREAAQVEVNGKRAGAVWHPPYELDITPLLRAGTNDLRIVAGNLGVNEMAGNPLPDRTALIARYGERFQDQGNSLVQAVPSGLMGPIRLVARHSRGPAHISP